jgi:large subunit ribosomal protein L28
MVKKCDIIGTGVMSGNNVSHANNHTRRRFLPNLQEVSLFSEALNKSFKLKICVKTLRSIEHNGGLDSYLESIAASKLSDEALKIKKAIQKKKGSSIKPEASKAPRNIPARIAKKAAQA